MKRLLTTVAILTGLIGSAGAVWADAVGDYKKGYADYQAKDYPGSVKLYSEAADQGHAMAKFRLEALEE